MKVFVIVVTYNGKKWIKKCLDSLHESTYKTSIIIIDNGSNDGTQNFIKPFKEIQFIQSEENLGFGKANNLGIKLALKKGADYVFLLNQDAWIEKNTIKNLIDVSYLNKNLGIVSPLHLNGSGTALDKQFSYFIAPSIQKPSNKYFSDLVVNNIKEYYEVSFINAAAWLIPKEIINKIGYFDELFYHYGEDINYCQRIKFHKSNIVFSTKSIIYHDREYRKINADQELKIKQIKLLNKLTDINQCEVEIMNQIKNLKNYYKLCIFKNIFTLRVSKFKSNYQKINFLNKNLNIILDSLRKNKAI